LTKINDGNVTKYALLRLPLKCTPRGRQWPNEGTATSTTTTRLGDRRHRRAQSLWQRPVGNLSRLPSATSSTCRPETPGHKVSMKIWRPLRGHPAKWTQLLRQAEPRNGKEQDCDAERPPSQPACPAALASAIPAMLPPLDHPAVTPASKAGRWVRYPATASTPTIGNRRQFSAFENWPPDPLPADREVRHLPPWRLLNIQGALLPPAKRPFFMGELNWRASVAQGSLFVTPA
jgi:hypothetical protein